MHGQSLQPTQGVCGGGEGGVGARAYFSKHRMVLARSVCLTGAAVVLCESSTLSQLCFGQGVAGEESYCETLAIVTCLSWTVRVLLLALIAPVVCDCMLYAISCCISRSCRPNGAIDAVRSPTNVSTIWCCAGSYLPHACHPNDWHPAGLCTGLEGSG